ncbi:hypothetical protein OROGR_020591 [Orobanche gracilis]
MEPNPPVPVDDDADVDAAKVAIDPNAAMFNADVDAAEVAIDRNAAMFIGDILHTQSKFQSLDSIQNLVHQFENLGLEYPLILLNQNFCFISMLPLRTQLHPTSWGYVKGFQIRRPFGFLSLIAKSHNIIMKLYSSNMGKEFQKEFFRMVPPQNFPFPLGWTSDPIMGHHDRKIVDQVQIDRLSAFKQVSTYALVKIQTCTDRQISIFLARQIPNMSNKDVDHLIRSILEGREEKIQSSYDQGFGDGYKAGLKVGFSATMEQVATLDNPLQATMEDFGDHVLDASSYDIMAADNLVELKVGEALPESDIQMAEGIMAIALSKPQPKDSDSDHHVEFAAGNVKLITTKEAWDEKSEEAKRDGKIVIANFSATWCGPCKMIAPYYSELSEKYTSVMFLLVDVDELALTSVLHGISKPHQTFFFLKDGKEVDKLVGANKPELQKKLASINDFVPQHHHQ